MSFRRDSEQSRHWQQWLAQHRDALAAAGVPDWVYVDEPRWRRFLGEGGLDGESGWRVEMLSSQQAERLRAFLVAQYGPEDYGRCLRSLGLGETTDRPRD